jgi:hypothetical protein
MAMTAFPDEGGCDCRAVRFRLRSRPLFVHCCHCRWCQRERDAAFALNAMIEADRVINLGVEPEIVHTYYEREALWPPESLARRQAILPLIEAYQASLRA